MEPCRWRRPQTLHRQVTKGQAGYDCLWTAEPVYRGWCSSRRTKTRLWFELLPCLLPGTRPATGRRCPYTEWGPAFSPPPACLSRTIRLSSCTYFVSAVSMCIRFNALQCNDQIQTRREQGIDTVIRAGTCVTCCGAVLQIMLPRPEPWGSAICRRRSFLWPQQEAVGQQLLELHRQEEPLPGRALAGRRRWREAGLGSVSRV